MPWTAVALVVAAIVVFALGVRELGLVPALLLSTFLAALRDAATRSGPPVSRSASPCSAC